MSLANEGGPGFPAAIDIGANVPRSLSRERHRGQRWTNRRKPFLMRIVRMLVWPTTEKDCTCLGGAVEECLLFRGLMRQPQRKDSHGSVGSNERERIWNEPVAVSRSYTFHQDRSNFVEVLECKLDHYMYR